MIAKVVVKTAERSRPPIAPSNAPCAMLSHHTFDVSAQPITLIKYMGLTAPLMALVLAPTTIPANITVAAIPTSAKGRRRRGDGGLAYPKGSGDCSSILEILTSNCFIYEPQC